MAQFVNSGFNRASSWIGATPAVFVQTPQFVTPHVAGLANQFIYTQGFDTSDADTEIFALTPSGVDTADLVDSSTTRLSLTPSSGESAQFTDSGTELLGLSGTGSDVAQFSDSGSELLALTPSSADVADIVDAGTSTLKFTPSALEGKESFDSGTVGFKLTPKAAEVIVGPVTGVDYRTQSDVASPGAGVADITITRPPEAITGDLLIFCASYDHATGTSNVTLPTGWAILDQHLELNSGGQGYYTFVAVKVLTSDSDPSSYTFSIVNASPTWSEATLLDYANADRFQPIADFAIVDGVSSSVNVSGAYSAADTVIIGIAIRTTNATVGVVTVPTDLRERRATFHLGIGDRKATDRSRISETFTYPNDGSTIVRAISIAVQPPQYYSDVIYVDNPSAYWRLGETDGTGSGAHDEGGTFPGVVRHNLDYNGAITYNRPGPLGSDSDAVMSASNNARASTPVAAPFDQTDNITIECWYKRDGAHDVSYIFPHPIISIGGYFSDHSYALLFDNTEPSLALFVNGTYMIEAALIPTADTWYYLAAKRENGHWSMYINDKRYDAVPSREVTPHLLTSVTGNMGVGDVIPSNYSPNGDLTLAAWYNYAISDERLAAHYNMGIAPSTAPQDSNVEWFRLRPSAIDIGQPSDAAVVVVSLVPLSTEQYTTVDSGTESLQFTVSGSDLREHPTLDSDTGVLGLVPAGVENASYADSASESLILTPSSTETGDFTDIGTVSMVFSVSAADIAGFVDATTVPISLTPSTSESIQAVDSASIGLSLVPSGSDTISAVDTGSLSLKLTPLLTAETFGKDDAATVNLTISVLPTVFLGVYANDTFTRTVAAGLTFGNADLGGAWTARFTTAGTAYSVNGTVAQVATVSTGGSWGQSLPAQIADVDLLVRGSWSLNAAGATFNGPGLIARYQDANNYYRMHIQQFTGGTTAIQVNKVVAGVVTQIGGSGPNLGAYTPGDFYWVRLQVIGSAIRAKAWKDGTAEPGWGVDTTDTALPNAGFFGVRTQVIGGSTVAPVVSFDDFSASPVAPDIAQFVDTGTQTLALTVSGSETKVLSDAATESFKLTPSAIEARESTDQATETLLFTISGVDTQQTVDSSVVKVNLDPSATVEIAQFVDTDIVRLKYSVSAVESAEFVDAATQPIVFSPSGTDTFQAVDQDTVKVTFTVGTFEFLDRADIGTEYLSFQPSADERWVRNTDAGTLYLQLMPQAIEVFRLTDIVGTLYARYQATAQLSYTGTFYGNYQVSYYTRYGGSIPFARWGRRYA